MAVNLRNPKYYFNRELSWLKFNERVLEEARDESHPLLERLKFLAIFSSNLDEFYMIRVAGLKEQMFAGIEEVPADGLSAAEQLELSSILAHEQVAEQSRILLEDVLPKLRKKGVRLRTFSSLSPAQKEKLKILFKEKVFPVITPMAIDPTHPFPQLRNLGLNLLVELKVPYKRTDRKKAMVPVPALLDRFIPVPGKEDRDFILVEDLILHHLEMLFPKMKIHSASEFRLTRNADLDLSEAEADDLLKLIEKELRKRRLGTVNRLEVSNDMSAENRRFLMQMTGLNEQEVYDIHGFLDLSAFMKLAGLDIPELRDKKFTPVLKEKLTGSRNIFEALRQHDVLLHHPYDSFNHVVDLIQEAARDPQVLAIKQTLYRTSGNSPIVQALKDAVNKGKQVTALIELKARFDEETNITWAKELERAGVNVIYGILGLKTHCKICMVVRKENDQIRRYLHLSTGNYNARTAKIYTDMGLMTSDEEMGKDASDLFNLLTGYSRQEKWRKFFIAPVNLRENIEMLIRNCEKHHSTENPSRIRMVMNSLVDPDMIRHLYRASMKGIRIDLVVRGICCLKPGLKGVSENITVRSIVGRFLEHCRIFIFEYNGNRRIYLGSADLMQRNLNRRVELVFPVENTAIQERIVHVTDLMLADNVKARELQVDGEYVRLEPENGQPAIDSQEQLLLEATERRQHIDTIISR